MIKNSNLKDLLNEMTNTIKKLFTYIQVIYTKRQDINKQRKLKCNSFLVN